MFDVMAIVAEVQKFKEWIPLINKSDIVDYSHFRRYTSFGVTLPWPMWNRGLELQVTALPYPGRNAMMAVLKSINADTFLGLGVDRSIYID